MSDTRPPSEAELDRCQEEYLLPRRLFKPIIAEIRRLRWLCSDTELYLRTVANKGERGEYLARELAKASRGEV